MAEYFLKNAGIFAMRKAKIYKRILGEMKIPTEKMHALEAYLTTIDIRLLLSQQEKEDGTVRFDTNLDHLDLDTIKDNVKQLIV